MAGFDHRLFARAASLKAAHALVDIYTALGAKVAAIDSTVSKRRQDQAEEALLSGELGRFARTNDIATGDATLIAPISRLRDATSRLFEEGIDIAQLIDAAAQHEIAEGAVDREILDVLKTKIQAESDYDAVSPLPLKLYAHARIFEVCGPPDFNQFGAIIGRKLKLAKQWMSDDGLTTLLLTVDHEPPNWATSDVLVNVRHDAFLLAYNEATKFCFIGSTRRTDRLCSSDRNSLELLCRFCQPLKGRSGVRREGLAARGLLRTTDPPDENAHHHSKMRLLATGAGWVRTKVSIFWPELSSCRIFGVQHITERFRRER